MECNEPKVQHKYRVKTTAKIWIGTDGYFEIPVEFTVRQMPWDIQKSKEKLIQETVDSAIMELNWKKKHMSIEQIF